VRRKHAQADDKNIAESLEVVRVEARIDDKEEDRGDLGRPRKGVLDRRVLGKKLRRKVVGRKVLIVRRAGQGEKKSKEVRRAR
jgi:hypothetical protein